MLNFWRDLGKRFEDEAALVHCGMGKGQKETSVKLPELPHVQSNDDTCIPSGKQGIVSRSGGRELPGSQSETLVLMAVARFCPGAAATSIGITVNRLPRVELSARGARSARRSRSGRLVKIRLPDYLGL